MLARLGVDTTIWHDKSNALQSLIPIPGQAFHLIPVGSWILDEPQSIEKFAHWRFSARESFFARFPESADSMRNFLNSRYIDSNDSQLFAICDEHACLFGHLGIKDCSSKRATIDSVMKSHECEIPGVMEGALRALIHWVEATLDISSLDLKVISSNTRAIRLYEKVGFRVTESTALISLHAGLVETLKEVEDSSASVRERSLTMCREI